MYKSNRKLVFRQFLNITNDDVLVNNLRHQRCICYAGYSLQEKNGKSSLIYNHFQAEDLQATYDCQLA